MNNSLHNVFERQKALDLDRYGKYLIHKGLSRPLMLLCETTSYCNNNCIICANSIMTREKAVMPMDTFRLVLDSYSEMGGGRLSLTPVVGDIFMDPFLPDRLDLIAEYKQKGISTLSVTTNAVMAGKYSERELRRIVNCFGRIFISIYGLDADEYKAMTRRDTFYDMMESVRTILRLIDDVEKIGFGFRLLREFNDGDLESWTMRNFGVKITYQAMNTYANWGKLDTRQRLPQAAKWLPDVDNTVQCFIPLFAMQVFSNGGVAFCPCDDFNSDEDLLLGNIRNNSLLEIYNTERVKKLWDFESHIPSFCRRCSFHRPVSQLVEYPWIFDRPLDYIGG
ncbi:MAG: radical SAM/SPASM domain-containing protein [Thermodesulfovibrionales bacterium]